MHPTTSNDNELLELLRKNSAVIKVVGCGGAGNNTINRLFETGVEGAELIALNTDAKDLLKVNAHRKILIGKDTTKGLGAGANPEMGEKAAKENEQQIKEAIAGANLIFVTCGLGGGTGTGSIPMVAQLSKSTGAITVGIVTLPFEMEGKHRKGNADAGLEKLRPYVDTLLVIPNDKLLELAPNVPISIAFRVVDEILVNAVKGITEIITRPGLINRDFADLRAIMTGGGTSLIGIGQSDTENRAVEAVEKAINNPLIEVDIGGAKSALVQICGGPDFTLEEAHKIISLISGKLDPDAKLIWGAQIDENLKNTLKVMLIITGLSQNGKKEESDETSHINAMELRLNEFERGPKLNLNEEEFDARENQRLYSGAKNSKKA